MTSTSVTKVGGVVIVTQVIPQDETAAIPMGTPAATTTVTAQAPPTVTATQVPPPAAKAPPPSPHKIDDMTSTFLRGEPQGLGVVQIIVGVLCLLFSLTAVFSPILLAHAPFCLAVTFIISGSLSLAAVRRTSVKLVCASLGWNLISVLFGLVGVAYTCWLLADRPASQRFCESETSGGFVPVGEEIERCISRMRMLDVSVYGPLGLLLVLLVLQVCVSITVSVFSARAIKLRANYAPIMVEVDDDSALLSGDAALLQP
ncbi:membrane-spanning 4-domains subfamily A member 4A [Symphorus nematophorus]